MSWDKGFNFRATSGFVVDAANCTYVLADAYPTTRNGVTFGWQDSITGNSRDRSNTVGDTKLAGINFTAGGGGAKRFQVDLPATGSYSIRLAMGDETASFATDQIVFKDNTTTLFTIGSAFVGNAAANFYEAGAGALLSDTVWPGSNTPNTKTFATTTLIALLGGNSDTTPLAHIFISQNAVVPTGPIFVDAPATVVFAYRDYPCL